MRLFTITIFILAFQISYCQDIDNINRVYDFFNEVIIGNTESDMILSEIGTSELLLEYDDSINFYPLACFFKDEKYRNSELWDTVYSNADKEFMLSQIKQLKKFKWIEEKLHSDITIFSKKQIHNYSKSLIKSEKKYLKGKIKTSDIPFKTINTYSAPIFNENETLALVYYESYSGLLSSMSVINVYLKIHDKWILIGTELIGMS